MPSPRASKDTPAGKRPASGGSASRAGSSVGSRSSTGAAKPAAPASAPTPVAPPPALVVPKESISLIDDAKPAPPAKPRAMRALPTIGKKAPPAPPPAPVVPVKPAAPSVPAPVVVDLISNRPTARSPRTSAPEASTPAAALRAGWRPAEPGFPCGSGRRQRRRQRQLRRHVRPAHADGKDSAHQAAHFGQRSGSSPRVEAFPAQQGPDRDEHLSVAESGAGTRDRADVVQKARVHAGSGAARTRRGGFTRWKPSCRPRWPRSSSTRRRNSNPARRSSFSWVTSTTARPR